MCTMLRSILLTLLAFSVPAGASAATQWPNVWRTAAADHGLDPAVLYAAALEASGRASDDGRVAPWPWTLRVSGRLQHYQGLAQARRALAALRADDTDLIGQRREVRVGIMGVPLEGSPQDDTALDPRKNLKRGAELLARRLAAAPEEATRLAKAAEPLRGAMPTASAGTQTTRGEAAAPASYAACLPEAKRPVAEAVATAARRHNLDPAYALAVALNESALRQSAVSPAGARGIMQLMPGTAARYGADPSDADQNIEAGVRYLRDLAELFGSDPRLVAAGYNAGEGAVMRHGGLPPYRETLAYVPKVLATRKELMRCAAATK
jgi:soluble lytic murein transglycosylase-like protein